jgi:hypothetical protein
MRTTDRNARDTRWLYRIENRTLKFNRYANEDRPIEELRKLADRVWAAEAPAGRHKPMISAAPGVKMNGRFTSYCEGFKTIVLARHHRNVLVLLHELTHALGPCLHGPKFIRRYFPLLAKYGGYNRPFLQTIAAERGISL